MKWSNGEGDLGLFLEIEHKKVDRINNVEEIKDRMRDVLRGLDFNFEELNKGKPELMLEKIGSNLGTQIFIEK